MSATAIGSVEPSFSDRAVPIDLSIVMPVYNEAAVIENVITEVTKEICDHLYRVEIVLVDDASTDETHQILDRIAASDSRIRVFHAERNGGHGPTLRRALDESRGEWIFQLDSDGQQVAAEFWDLWARRSEADLVMGMRGIQRNGRLRVVVSALARWTNRVLGGGDIRDVNVPFKLARRVLWRDLEGEIPRQPVAPSMLLAVGAAVRGWRVVQVPITCKPRLHGPSTVNLRTLVRLSGGAFGELIVFRTRLLCRQSQANQPAEARALTTA